MSIEIYKKLNDEVTDAMVNDPTPLNPSKEECERMAEIRDTLKAMNAAELGIHQEELDGSISLAEDRFRVLVRAKR